MPTRPNPARHAGLITGLLWNPTFPINKNLWTSSYVLYSAGWSLLALALCYWLIDMRRLNETRAGKALLWPWLVFGSNAITAFVISNFLVITFIWIKVPDSLSTTGNPSPPGSGPTTTSSPAKPPPTSPH